MEKEKLLESKSILMKLANGINPLNNEPINDHSFLHDPQIIRPLFYLSDYISKQLEVKKIPPRKPATFHITDEQLKQVTLPLGKIGINDFSKAINVVIDPTISKKLTGTMINKKLKAIGILSEEVDGNGHRVKVKNDKSEGYGIESETRTFNGREYKKVVFNEIGKQFFVKKY